MCYWLGVKTRLAAEKDESRSGYINKSKGWHKIWNLCFLSWVKFVPFFPLQWMVCLVLKQKTSQFFNPGGEQYCQFKLLLCNGMCVSRCVLEWKTAEILQWLWLLRICCFQHNSLIWLCIKAIYFAIKAGFAIKAMYTHAQAPWSTQKDGSSVKTDNGICCEEAERLPQ